MRKLLSTLGLVLGLCVPAFGQAAYVKNVTFTPSVPNADTNSVMVLTLTTGVAQGDRLILGLWRYVNTSGLTVTGVVDSRSNTYTIDSKSAGFNCSADRQTAVASAHMTTALQTNDTITITWSGSALSYFSAIATEYSGVDTTTSAKDQAEDTLVDPATQAAGITSGATGTQSASNNLVYGIIQVAADRNVTAGAGYTDRATIKSLTVTTSWRVVDKVLSGDTSAQTVTGTWDGASGNQAACGLVVTYKQGAAAASPRTMTLLGAGADD